MAEARVAMPDGQEPGCHELNYPDAVGRMLAHLRGRGRGDTGELWFQLVFVRSASAFAEDQRVGREAQRDG